MQLLHIPVAEVSILHRLHSPNMSCSYQTCTAPGLLPPAVEGWQDEKELLFCQVWPRVKDSKTAWQPFTHATGQTMYTCYCLLPLI